MIVKIAKYIVFWVYSRSYLICPPVIVEAMIKSPAAPLTIFGNIAQRPGSLKSSLSGRG